MPNHIACSWDGKSMLRARFEMKEFTVSISLKEPDSNPRESWKMNWGLLLNMSWLSISCSPRCGEVSRSVLGWGYDSYLRWLLHYGGVELQLIASGLNEWICYVRYLFSGRTEDLRIFDRVACFLQEGCLPSVCPPDDEDTKMTTLAAEIDSFVHDNWW